MPPIPREPLHFGEIFKSTLWGGWRLKRLLGKELPSGETVGESWEVSDHPNGMSVVDEGPLAGTSLHDLVVRDEHGLIGRKNALESGGRFPLLIKFIDASQSLSLQVHPDDAWAKKHGTGDAGKSEAWCVLQAALGSKVARGFVGGMTKEKLAEVLRAGQVEKHLNFVEVRRGDVIDVPAGTVHSLGAGALIAEVQQASDTTYRVWDWGRMGADGKPRALQQALALDVVSFDAEKSHSPLVRPEILIRERPWHERLVANDKFTFDRLTSNEAFDVRPLALKSFVVLVFTEGEGKLAWEEGSRPVRRGETLLLPGAMKSARVLPKGRVEVLAISLPLK